MPWGTPACPGCGRTLRWQTQVPKKKATADEIAQGIKALGTLAILGIVGFFILKDVVFAPGPPTYSRTIYTQSGTGDTNTSNFNVSGNWGLKWTYDCRNLGLDDQNFIVDVYRGDASNYGNMVNELGITGSGTADGNDNGPQFLRIQTGCNWAVKVAIP